MPVFHENLFKILCGRVVTNGKISFAFVLACLCSLGELNFSKVFMNERGGIAFVTEPAQNLFYIDKIPLD